MDMKEKILLTKLQENKISPRRNKENDEKRRGTDGNFPSKIEFSPQGENCLHEIVNIVGIVRFLYI